MKNTPLRSLAIFFITNGFLSINAVASTHHRNVNHLTIEKLKTSSSTPAPESPLGLGVMVGNMNGVSGKYWTSEKSAIDGGFSYSAEYYATLHTSYLWDVSQLFGLHLPGHEKKNRNVLSPYLGIGAILFFDTSYRSAKGNQSELFQKLKSNGLALGARVPFGVEFQPSGIPCGLFGEIAPGTVLVPGTVGILDGEVGVRFYM